MSFLVKFECNWAIWAKMSKAVVLKQHKFLNKSTFYLIKYQLIMHPLITMYELQRSACFMDDFYKFVGKWHWSAYNQVDHLNDSRMQFFLLIKIQSFEVIDLFFFIWTPKISNWIWIGYSLKCWNTFSHWM